MDDDRSLRLLNHIWQDTQSGGNRLVVDGSASRGVHIYALVRAILPDDMRCVNRILDLKLWPQKLFCQQDMIRLILTSVLLK